MGHFKHKGCRRRIYMVIATFKILMTAVFIGVFLGFLTMLFPARVFAATDIPPQTIMRIDIPNFTDGQGHLFVNSTTRHALSATDMSGSGIKETLHRYYTGSNQSPFILDNPFSISGDDGPYTVEYYSTDNLGNTEATKSAHEYLDNTPSVTTEDVGEPKSTDAQEHLWISSATPHTLVGNDGNGSGIATTSYRYYITGSTPPSEWNTGTTFTINLISDTYGPYTVEYYSTDNLGNTEATKSAQEYLQYGIPTLDSLSTNSAKAGDPETTFTINGTSFVSGSVVKWYDPISGTQTDLATTFISNTQLSAVIPAINLATAKTIEVTVFNPAPGGGTSNTGVFFITESGTGVVSSSIGTGTDTGETITTTTGGDGSTTPGSVTATALGSGTVAVANYSGDPGSTPSFSSSGMYFDVYVSPNSNLTEFNIVECDQNGGTQAYWWNGTSWNLADSQSYDPNTSCITILVNSTSSPSFSDLKGTIFSNGHTPPAIESIVPNTTDPIALGSTGATITATVNLNNPNETGNNPYAVLTDWGDGNTTPGTLNQSLPDSITESHTYLIAGVYTIKATVTDKYGGKGLGSYQYVVVYDPSAGFVTGGGWINSPAGSLTSNLSLTGKATFGFTSRYVKGAKVPTGQTEFQFKTGNLIFHSTTYDWLVIGGAKAQYKGTGTINGTGNYSFILTAIDGNLNGGTGVDKFRIKIVDKTSGTVVYDNQMYADDTSDPTTSIAGGSIVIHKN